MKKITTGIRRLDEMLEIAVKSHIGGGNSYLTAIWARR